MAPAILFKSSLLHHLVLFFCPYITPTSIKNIPESIHTNDYQLFKSYLIRTLTPGHISPKETKIFTKFTPCYHLALYYLP